MSNPVAVWATFRMESESASDVFLMGAFNNWSTAATRMEQIAEGVWEAGLHLLPGVHQVAYALVFERHGVVKVALRLMEPFAVPCGSESGRIWAAEAVRHKEPNIFFSGN